MANKIQVRRDTAANWTSTNPTLSQGEIGFETDTYKIKIGNGSSAWADLGYFTAAGLSAAQGITFVGDDSTGTRISDGETVKIVGAGSVTTAMSGDVLTITGSGGGANVLTVVGDDSTGTSFNSGETLKVAGGTGITTAMSGDVLTITGVPQATMTFVGDDSTGVTLNNAETLKIAGSGGITTAVSGDTLTIDGSGVAGGGGYSLKVAADDSTARTINSGETIQFVGTNGVTTTSDAEGKITISAAGVTGLYSRTTATATTSSIAQGATGNITITGYKGYALYKIQTSHGAWIRIYTSTAARSSDSARAEGADPTPGSGVVAEVITAAAGTVLISPGAIGYNDEATPSTGIYCAVTNRHGSTQAITVTLTLVALEV